MKPKLIFRWLTRLYAVVAMLAVAVALTVIFESIGLTWFHATNRAYRLLSIFFLLGLPSTLFVATVVAFVSRAALNWMKRNA